MLQWKLFIQAGFSWFRSSLDAFLRYQVRHLYPATSAHFTWTENILYIHGQKKKYKLIYSRVSIAFSTVLFEIWREKCTNREMANGHIN